jgi:hypothetical protein
MKTFLALAVVALALPGCGCDSGVTRPSAVPTVAPGLLQLQLSMTGPAVNAFMETPSLTTSPPGTGGCGFNCSTFPPGTRVTITATGGPDENTLVSWSGACSGVGVVDAASAGGTCTVTMNSDLVVGTTWKP